MPGAAVVRSVNELRKPLPAGAVQEPLFDPLYLPVAGLFSSLDPLSLTPGEWRKFGGFRRDQRDMRVRDAHIRYDAGGLPSDGSFRGRFAGQLVGTNFFNVGVYRRSGTSRVHIYATNTGTFTEITTASGQHGDTRFSDSTNPVYIEAVTDKRNGNEYLIFQNAIDSPRVWTPGGDMAIHRTIGVPKQSSDLKALATFPVYFPIAGTTRPTYSNVTPGKFSLADTGTTPNFSMLLTVDSTWTVSTDTAQALFAAPIDASSCRQLTFAAETDILNFWDSLKIELGDGSGYYVAWDPTDASKVRTRAIEFDATTSREVIGFNIDAIADSCSAVDRVRFSWVGVAPPADITMKIHMIAGSGRVRGRARHKITYMNSASRAESYGILIPTVENARIKDLGGPDLDGVRLPNVRELFYRYDVKYQNTSTTERDRGVNIVSIYRKDEGEDKYILVDEATLATWGGASWSYSSGTEFSVRTYSDNIDAFAKQWAIEAPSAEHVPVPISGPMLSANNRLFVGARSASSYNPGVWFSAKNYPFRFRAVGPFGDPDSGSSFLLTGESITGFAAVGSSTVGASTIIIFSEKRVFQVNGLTTMNLLKWTTLADDHGTKSPFSISVHAGMVYYVDDRMQMRRIANGIDNLSRLTVNDKLTNVPASRRAWVTGAFHNERYYVGYTIAGQTTNQRALIFNELLEQVEADDPVPAPFTVEAFAPYFNDTLKRHQLLAYSSDARVYEYEQPGATLDFTTTKPVIELSPRAIHYPEQVFTINKLGFYCDGDSGSVLTVTERYGRVTTAVRTQTINLTLGSGKSHIYAWTRPATNSGKPLGPSCQLDITGSMTGGKKIFELVYEVQLGTGFGRDG